MLARPVAVALSAALACTLLSGCSQAPSESDVRSACEAKVGAGVVNWWEGQYGDRPWDVIDAKSTSVKRGSESDGAVTVFYVSGSANVRADHRNTATEPVRWSCFSQYRNDDKQVVAAIRSVSAR